MAKKIMFWILPSFILLVALAYWAVLQMTRMPGASYRGPFLSLSSAETEVAERLRRHVESLAGAIGERNLWKYRQLNQSFNYIQTAFLELGYSVSSQTFQVRGNDVNNVIATVPGGRLADRVVVVGAHYDSVFGSPGANDNGSGAAALLEIARLLAGNVYPRTLHLVAFVNEEPPFFLSDQMGSLRYAEKLKLERAMIEAMISIETIGYYSERRGSQKYPFPFRYFYPQQGDFIAFVGNLSSRRLVLDCVAAFRRLSSFPSEGVAAPGWIPGIGWSDHWSFWQQGYPAVMVTDTALYRYPYYHTLADTPDKIDYPRMARVVAGLARLVEDLVAPEGKND